MLEVENIVEDVIEDLGLGFAMYRIEGVDKPHVDKIEVYIDVKTNCFKEVTLDNVNVRVMCRRVESNVVEVYRHLVENMVNVALDILGSFINRNEEYMVILVEKGYAIVLQGTPERVVVPVVPGTLFTCHTHPMSFRAVFSKEDVKSLLEILSSRGFGSCVTTQYSCLTIYRYSPFDLDDYFKLFNAIKEYEYLDSAILRSLNLNSVDYFEIAI
jgi:hypothetical protein